MFLRSVNIPWTEFNFVITYFMEDMVGGQVVKHLVDSYANESRAAAS